MRYQTEATPIYTMGACDHAYAAGAMVEFTACGCDYDRPPYLHSDSAGWVPLKKGDAPRLFANPGVDDRFRAFYPEPEV